MRVTKAAKLDSSVEKGQEWVLPEVLRQRAEAGEGLYGHLEAFAEGTDLIAAQPHAILDPDYAETYVRNLIRHLNRLGIDLSGNMLDAGCALGMLSDAFRRVLGAGTTIHGIDLAHTIVAKARQNYPDCRFEVHSADDLSIYPNDHFGLIHLREFYPFTRSGSVGFHMRFLEAMLPKLRPGGLVAAIQIVDKRGLADTIPELERLCVDVGYRRVFRQVVVPIRMYRRWGDLVHRPLSYWGISLAGNALEMVWSSRVSFIYGFQKPMV